LVRALDREVVAVGKRPFEKDLYPRPRGPCQELVRAAHMFGARDLTPSMDVETPGQAVVFLCAVGASDKYRPESWERDYGRLMQHELPYIREVSVKNLPLPAPDSLFQLLPGLITDKDVDVAIAACGVAEKIKRPELKEPVLKALATAREDCQFGAASSAAWALDAKWARLQILVSRLDEEGMTGHCLDRVVGTVLEDRGSYSGPSDKWTAREAKAVKARWVKFLQEHEDELKSGKRFKRDDPGITPDLYPTMDLNK
jgi:hypothetical protein